MGSCRRAYNLAPEKVAYWRPGLWRHFLKAGARFEYQFFPPFPLVHILLDTSGLQPYTVTSLSCSLGFLNFTVGNYVFAKNNILIKCPLEPNCTGAVTLPKKRQGSQDLEFKVG